MDEKKNVRVYMDVIKVQKRGEGVIYKKWKRRPGKKHIEEGIQDTMLQILHSPSVSAF